MTSFFDQLQRYNFREAQQKYEEEMMKASTADVENRTKLTDLPFKAMKTILWYLKYGDKYSERDNFTLRLVSKRMKQIVDLHVELAWRVDLDNVCVPGHQQMVNNSDRDVHVDLRCVEEAVIGCFLLKYPHKIYRITGRAPMVEIFLKVQETPKLEKVVCLGEERGKDMTDTFFSPHRQFHNLKILTLASVGITNVEDVKLPCLETLVLYDLYTFSPFTVASILATCSSSLKKLVVEAKHFQLHPIKDHQLEMKKLKTITVKFQHTATGLVELLSSCSQSLQYLKINGESRIQGSRHELTCDFPRLKTLFLEKVKLKPFLALLRSSPVLDMVLLWQVDYACMKEAQYDVTSIKDLQLSVDKEVGIYDDFEGSLATMFEFLGKCTTRTEVMRINGKRVDYNHLMPGNFALFKTTYEKPKTLELTKDQFVQLFTTGNFEM